MKTTPLFVKTDSLRNLNEHSSLWSPKMGSCVRLSVRWAERMMDSISEVKLRLLLWMFGFLCEHTEIAAG